MIESLDLMVKTIAFYGCKPSLLQACLENIGINSDRSLIIAKLWSENSRNINSQLREKAVSAPRLENISWKTGITASSSAASEQNVETATIQLKLENQQPLQIEFNKSSLENFYNQLETIQERLDSLQ